MSKVRRSGSSKIGKNGLPRVVVNKNNVVCNKCGNNKIHTNGSYLKCTKCKSEDINVLNKQKLMESVKR